MNNYDYLKTSDGTGDAALMTISQGRARGDATIHVDNTSRVSPYFIATYGTLGSDKFLDPSTTQTFYGHLSAGNLIIDQFAPGSEDKGNVQNQVVVIKPSTARENDFVNLARVSHNADGTVKSGVIGTAQIIDGSITGPKIASTIFTHSISERAPNEIIPAGGYTDVGGAQSMTVIVPPSGRVLFTFGATFYNDTDADRITNLSVDVSGANTISPGAWENDASITHKSARANSDITASRTRILTGLTPGSTVFTLKYVTSSGGTHVYRRYMNALTLP